MYSITIKKRMAPVILLLGVTLTGCDNSVSSANATEPNTVSLYIVRHGKTMLNTTDRVQGWSDAVLTPAGEKSVDYTAIGLKDIDFNAAYSSDSGRAVQTANIILAKSKNSKLQLKTDWRLREFNFGSYEGDLNHTMWNELASLEGKTQEEWRNSFTPQSFADGVAELDKQRSAKLPAGTNWPAEPYEVIDNRLQDSLTDIISEISTQGGGNVLIVSHGLSIGAIVAHIDPNIKFPDGGFKNASVTKITYSNGDYSVDALGDMTFNEEGKKSSGEK